MRHIDAPDLDTGTILSQCGRGHRINRVTALHKELAQSERAYLHHSNPSLQLWALPKNPAHLSKTQLKDVSWAYEDKLGRKKGAARGAYDIIRSQAEFCPTCLKRTVEALDHYLPQEVFPELAITPSNLVPICSDCNSAKLAQIAIGASDQFLHPYFDDLGGDTWIHATVQHVSPAAVRYDVQPLSHWGPVLTDRVQKHFSRFALGNLWSASAGVLLASLSGLLEGEYGRSGAAGVRSLIAEMARSYWSGGEEPWRAAALEAWARCNWFCNGGWR